MTLLEIVTEAMAKALVREDAPSTTVSATGIVADFVGYVNDTYRNIQLTAHGERWFFRQSLDLTLSLVASTSEYAMPAGLQTLNWRTVTCYLTTPKEEETPVEYIDYYYWRTYYNTRNMEEGKPQYITVKPDGTLELIPTPDDTYTLHFDGVLSEDTLSGDADTPILPVWAQRCLVWGAVQRFAEAHEDGSMLAKANKEYRPYYDSMVNYQTPDVHVNTSIFTNRYRR